MKTIFLNICSWPLPRWSQPRRRTRRRWSFIRIVNAISPGTGNAKFLIDGKDLFADGYQIGQTTGGYGVAVGTRTIEVRKEGLEKGSTQHKLAVGETITLIAFAEKIPPLKPEDPPKWRIKLLRLKQKDVQKGFNLTLVSVSQTEEVALQLNVRASRKQENASVSRLSVTTVDIGKSRSEVMVKYHDKALTTVSPDSRGNYVVVVYDNAEGQLEAINFYDPKIRGCRMKFPASETRAPAVSHLHAPSPE